MARKRSARSDRSSLSGVLLLAIFGVLVLSGCGPSKPAETQTLAQALDETPRSTPRSTTAATPIAGTTLIPTPSPTPNEMSTPRTRRDARAAIATGDASTHTRSRGEANADSIPDT